MFKRLLRVQDSARFDAGSSTLRKPAAVPTGAKGDFRAVSVVCGGNGCAAAKSIVGKRFLLSRPPRLPLADCTSPGTCACKYQKHDDRRKAGDRRSDSVKVRVVKGTGENRKSRGRRTTDR
jgi:hypothetical protein